MKSSYRCPLSMILALTTRHWPGVYCSRVCNCQNKLLAAAQTPINARNANSPPSQRSVERKVDSDVGPVEAATGRIGFERAKLKPLLMPVCKLQIRRLQEQAA